MSHHPRTPTPDELEQTLQIAQNLCVHWIGAGHPLSEDRLRKAFEHAEEIVEATQEYRALHENGQGGSFYG